MSGILHFIFLDQGWLQVTETAKWNQGWGELLPAVQCRKCTTKSKSAVFSPTWPRWPHSKPPCLSTSHVFTSHTILLSVSGIFLLENRWSIWLERENHTGFEDKAPKSRRTEKDGSLGQEIRKQSWSSSWSHWRTAADQGWVEQEPWRRCWMVVVWLGMKPSLQRRSAVKCTVCNYLLLAWLHMETQANLGRVALSHCSVPRSSQKALCSFLISFYLLLIFTRLWAQNYGNRATTSLPVFIVCNSVSQDKGVVSSSVFVVVFIFNHTRIPLLWFILSLGFSLVGSRAKMAKPDQLDLNLNSMNVVCETLE